MENGFIVGGSLIALAALLLFPGAAAYQYGYGEYTTTNRYQAYGVQPSTPILIGSEYRPEGYGLVRQGPAYPLAGPYADNNRFVGHRSNWDGRTAWYSGFDGASRLAPRARTVNPLWQQPQPRYASAVVYDRSSPGTYARSRMYG